MKLEIKKNELLEKLKICLKAIDSTHHLFALQSIFFTVASNEVVLIGSNGNLSIKTTIKQGPNLKIENIDSNQGLVSCHYCRRVKKT